MAACPRCIGGFVMTQYAGTEYEETKCLACAWYWHPYLQPEPPTYKDYGNCACGKESLRNTGDCARCRGAKVSQGMLKKKYLKVMV